MSATDEPPPAPKVEVVVSSRTVVKALAILLFIVLVVVAMEAILSIALAIVFVLGLDPPVAALERRGMGRGKAALLVFAIIAVATFVIVVWAIGPVWDEIRELVANLPTYIEEAKNSAFIKELDENTEALSKLQDALAEAAKSLPQAALGLLGAAGSLVGQIFTLVTLAFLTLFGLIGKPALTRSTLELMTPVAAERTRRTRDRVTHTISFALIGNVVISVIAGTVVGVTAVIVDAPVPVVLALIVGLFDLIPQVGSAIAAVIVVSITLAASGAGPAAVMLIVILVYQQLENYLIQPAVMKEAVELSGFATIASVLLGSALLGVVGAILAVPVAASVKIVVREVTDPRRERMAALRAAATPAVDGAPDPVPAATPGN
jgi:predicted PurR-regulated permease PerM